MIASIQGIFRDGKVELLEQPPRDISEARVVITFLPNAQSVHLADRGISPEQAADLRARLASFVQDWDRPEMDIYDEE
jgi:hypothetical protein